MKLRVTRSLGAALCLVGAVGVGACTNGGTSGSAVPSGSSAAGGPSSSGPAADDLVAVLPPDLGACRSAPLAGDGDVAAAQCGASTTQPGPRGAQFYRYADQATMDRLFAADLPPGLLEMSDDEDCTTTAGRTTWSTGDDRGQVACALSPAGQVVIAWTDEGALTEGVVIAPGTTQADLAALFEWWRSNSDYQS